FDIKDPNNLVWEERYTMIVNAYIKYLEDGNTTGTFKILQAYTANSINDIDKYHDQFVSEGYEGIMIRRYGSVEEKLSRYRPNRNNSLVVHKLFQDEKVVIIGYDSDTDGGIKFMVRDTRNNEFHVKHRESVKTRQEWYKNGDKFINKNLTIRYQKLSDKGIPIIPIGINVC
ncbi:unnamed protein product, partial [marine sediment metagenome]